MVLSCICVMVYMCNGGSTVYVSWCICAMVLSWWIVFLVYLCHILVQGSTELPIVAEMLIHFRFGENGALICT
jgi:hypothetical protein